MLVDRAMLPRLLMTDPSLDPPLTFLYESFKRVNDQTKIEKLIVCVYSLLCALI